MITPDSVYESNVEHFDHGLTRTYLYERRIVMVSGAKDVSRGTVDVYARLMIDSVNNFPDPHVTYLIINLSEATLSMTPYSRHRSIDIIKSVPPERTVYTAAVYGNRLLAVMSTVLVKTTLRVFKANIIYKTFLTVPEAVIWLEKCRTKHAQAANS